MFLRNYDNFMAAVNLFDNVTPDSSNISNSAGSFSDGYYNQKAANGTVAKIFYNCSSTLLPVASLSTRGICLGTGNTAVTYEDYQLSGNVIENKLVEVSKSVSYDATTHKFKRILVATYTNSGSTDLTISEWGLWRVNAQNAVASVTFTHTSSDAALVYRAVLSKPIVIEAGTTATLTFSIDVPMPNHP